jgi:hypothetical protein
LAGSFTGRRAEEVEVQVRVGFWVIAFWVVLAMAVLASIAHAVVA